jgi:hypothetical protein
MAAWGGGAHDTKRDRLIVWGGGHGDYGGNELYAFDVNTHIVLVPPLGAEPVRRQHFWSLRGCEQPTVERLIHRV